MKATYKEHTLADLHRKFRYKEETGELTWKEPHRYAGKVAGSKVESNGGYIYICTSINNKTKQLLAHRVVWFMHYGEPAPQDMQIDHINGDPSDNRISNLRVVTHRENQLNRKKRKRKVNDRYVLTSVPGIKFDKKQLCYVVTGISEELCRTYDFDDAKYVRWGWEFDNGYHELHGVK